MKVKQLLVFVLLTCFFNVKDTFSQDILIEENKGQWPGQVFYKADIPGASVFFEENIITYSLYDGDRLHAIHHEAHEKFTDENWKEADQIINCHAIKVNFIGAEKNVIIKGENKDDAYLNYFKGNDPSKWAGEVAQFKNLRYTNLYNGIDLFFLNEENKFKYEFYVAADADPHLIKFNYDGAEKLFLKNGNLHIATTINDLIEYKPVAWQIINGKKIFVKCNFKIENEIVSFDFPGGINRNYPLVIDPVVVASTFSGSTATTYGHCATYDLAGNIYSGGRAFSSGYPTTAGAFQVTFGGSVDIAVTKLNPTGTSRIYSTYIGGTDGDYVHSMYVDSATNQLAIYGSSSSSNYPVSSGAYDATYNGSTDIIVSRFNSTGSALIGSTFIGGSGNDGNNSIPKNYGDTYRGEIVLDNSGNIYVASFSSSTNFPTTPGAYDASNNGGQDGVVFKLNSNLSSLLWSTYIGGSGSDAAFGIKVDSYGDVYVVGCTSSPDIPTFATSYQAAIAGGTYDGFICKFVSNGTVLQFSTYYGTSSYDGIFFIDLDEDNNIFTYGITDGSIPITPGKYGNPGSRQFITKFDPFLSSVVWQTTFGDGGTFNNFSPTAFLVDICDRIYAAGWGSTTGFPTTPDAVQSTPGSFYVIVLEVDANSLLHATTYGATGDHVDGGTSRFDKHGIVYEGVCTNSSSFPTTPGAVSSTINSSWDIAVFKIEFNLSAVSADATANPSTGCSPLTVNFTNQGTSGSGYYWNFDDGNTSTLENPTHTFTSPGNYNVMFVVTDPNSCNVADTFYLPVNVINTVMVDLPTDTVACTGNSITLDAGNPGATYLWSTTATSQTINVNTPGAYIVTATLNGCSHSDTVNVQFTSTPTVSLGTDTTLCVPFNYQLNAGNPGINYLWSTNEITQTINVTAPGTYWVQVGPNGCAGYDTIIVNGINAPTVNLGSDVTLCDQTSYQLDAGNPGLNYLWSNNATTQTINVTTSGAVWVEVDNGCKTRDTININFITSPVVNLGPDTTLCNPFSLNLDAGNTGQSFLWSTNATTQNINVNNAGTYWVEVGPAGCSTIDSIVVSSINAPVVNLGQDVTLCDQSSYQLDAGNAGQNFLWSTNLTTQIITVTNSGTYWVDVGTSGCKTRDSINIDFLTSPNVSLGPDTTLCDPFVLSLNAGNPGQNYVWSTTATTQSINVNTGGTYWVAVGPAGCQGYDTLVVNSVSAPIVSLGNDQTFCDVATFNLDAGNPGSTYVWSTNSTSQNISVNTSGAYWVEVNNGYCTRSDTVNLTFLTTPVVSLGADSTLCAPFTFTLDAGNPGQNFTWSNNATTQTININAPGIYWVNVGPAGCSASDTITIQAAPQPVVNLGQNVILCDQTSYLLDAGNPGFNYLWSNNFNTQTIQVSASGIYSVVVSNSYCSDTDSIEVLFFDSPVFSLGPDIIQCGNNPVILDPGISQNIYSWSTGDSTQSIQVAGTGNYSVTVGPPGCSNSDTIYINMLEIPVPDIGPDTVLCDGDIIILSTIYPNYQHLWSTNDNSNSISVNASGTYIVTVTNQICTGTDTIDIFFEQAPQHVLTQHLPCVGDSVILDAANPGFNYLWSTGDSAQTITVHNSGTYFVEIYNYRCAITDSAVVEYVIIEKKDEVINGCDQIEVVLDAGNPGATYNWSEGHFSQHIIARDTGSFWVIIDKHGCKDTSYFKIETIVGTSNVFMPNAFTPNEDGLNELFFPVMRGIESFEFQIFNRWGELIYKSNDPEEGWDGTYNNEPLKQDVYIYKIEYTPVCNKKAKKEEVGKIMLMR